MEWKSLNGILAAHVDKIDPGSFDCLYHIALVSSGFPISRRLVKF